MISTGMSPWAFGAGILRLHLMKMKSLLSDWHTWRDAWDCRSLIPGDLAKDLDNSLTGDLMSSLSCDIHKSLPTAVLKSEWLSLSRRPSDPPTPGLFSKASSEVLDTGMIRSEVVDVLETESLLNLLNRISAQRMTLLRQWGHLRKPWQWGWHDLNSDPVKAQGSDLICERFILLRTWVKWICHDLGESLRPYNWCLRRQTVGSGQLNLEVPEHK